MQYISTGKFFECPNPNPTPKPHPQPNRRNSVTPTPRRISTSLIEQGRRSVTGKENEGRTSGLVGKQERSPRSSSKPLFVKGSNIVKGEESKRESKRKDGRAASGKKGRP
jgi:hypothetical protein